MAVARDRTVCAYPNQCQGTDAGGNCLMMRDVPWAQRTCWFNSEVWRQTDAGQADWDAQMEHATAICRQWEKEGRCYNCGGTDEEHGADGSCPTNWWDDLEAEADR